MQAESRRQYWETVRQCLRQLHGFTVVRVTTGVREYREEVKREHTENAVYHEEPYEVSCEIAGVQCDYLGQWDQYQGIRTQFLPDSGKLPDSGGTDWWS